ncbi:MAG: DUF86 domain-containing protein [Candidatus Jettenia sp.]|uniref:Nucleotidyltransferase n=1 Tax=Candidatus Jettenia caeni TaxID=247490 RepID=I3IHL7_9BACT|nr:DUF86 domain-containing protein [Candidatus Jettenia sp. AMX1]MBC6928520.1 DUF86 domain-containing protein [Candidatus Jettenia sp.]NUN23143.1 DUF86 domain-containing protein [Candidatus Jettenia caeni]KAA0251633.1 MAG: DUF86 domain-containing protein [Candidatus Jettenia sp. AMX1]MCE7879805.1 DUF86 domain-containing protein [Candidatus Jettenia sp. AMX1]MCQ3925916.1 DUF86 domain-containing protein [Candidatus Jettenia sp.]
MKRDEIYLKHIIDAINNIEVFIDKMGKDEFMKNKLVQSATIRQLEIIGEAVKNVSSHLRKSYSDISWKDIADLRDKLIHEYFGVDIQLVWIICVRDIPTLKKDVVKIIHDLEKNE